MLIQILPNALQTGGGVLQSDQGREGVGGPRALSTAGGGGERRGRGAICHLKVLIKTFMLYSTN